MMEYILWFMLFVLLFCHDRAMGDNFKDLDKRIRQLESPNDSEPVVTMKFGGNHEPSSDNL